MISQRRQFMIGIRGQAQPAFREFSFVKEYRDRKNLVNGSKNALELVVDIAMSLRTIVTTSPRPLDTTTQPTANRSERLSIGHHATERQLTS